MVYGAKRDRWLVALVLGVALLSLLPLAQMLLSSAGLAALPAALVAVPCGWMPLWIVFSVSYEITAAHLVVRVWPFRLRVPLAQVESVEAISGLGRVMVTGIKLAPSLDRLVIRCRRPDGVAWDLVVSPEDRDGFARQLSEAAPALRQEEPAGA